MTFETKEQVLEKVLSQEKPICPYCSTEMRLWEVPPINFSDGLGWGFLIYIYVLMIIVLYMWRDGII